MTITVQISATPELLGALNQLTGALMGKMPSAAVVTDSVAPTPNTSEPARQRATYEVPTAPAKTETASAPTSQYTLDDVKRIIVQKNKEGHREAIVGILRGLGFSSVLSIAPEKFSEVFTQVSAL